MIIQAELKCKQTGCEADPCAVDIAGHTALLSEFCETKNTPETLSGKRPIGQMTCRTVK